MKTKPVYKSPAARDLVLEAYAKILATSPCPVEETSVPSPLGETFILRAGPLEAPPLVLLHGAQSNALMFLGMLPALAAKYRVHVIDIPGEPGRSATVRAPWSGSAYPNWLGSVLDALALKRVLLAGYSLGGYLALRFAISYPERLTALLLAAPSGLAPARLSFVFKALFAACRGERGLESMERLITGKVRLPDEVRGFILLLARSVNPRFERQDMAKKEELARLTLPVHFIAGMDDGLLDSRRSAKILTAHCPQASITLLADCGHLIPHVERYWLDFLGEQTLPQ